MPERVNKQFKTVDSPDIMGEGSWVKFKALSMGDILPILSGEEMVAGDAAKLSGSQLTKLTLGVLPAIVADWNWVDDDGSPMPVSSDVINQLPYTEQQWLIENSGLSDILSTKN